MNVVLSNRQYPEYGVSSIIQTNPIPTRKGSYPRHFVVCCVLEKTERS